jgi:putative transposase
MGLCNLFAVVISEGSALLVKRGSIESEYYWWKREISTYQAVRDLLRKAGFSTWVTYHERCLKAIYKRDERLRHLYITSIRFLADKLYNKGVWLYRRIVLWIVNVFREYGIDVELAPEVYTSKECSICCARHKNERIYRGLYICRKTKKKINADINAALNIARRLGHRIRIKGK